MTGLMAQITFVAIGLFVGGSTGLLFWENYSLSLVEATNRNLGTNEDAFLRVLYTIGPSLFVMCAIFFPFLSIRQEINDMMYGEEPDPEPRWSREFKRMNAQSQEFGYESVYELAKKGSLEEKRKVNSLSSGLWTVRDKVIGHWEKERFL